MTRVVMNSSIYEENKSTTMITCFSRCVNAFRDSGAGNDLRYRICCHYQKYERAASYVNFVNRSVAPITEGRYEGVCDMYGMGTFLSLLRDNIDQLCATSSFR